MGTANSKEELFYEACGYGSVPRVKKYLQDKTININCVSFNGKSCPIHVASQGHLEVVQLLIAANCDVNVRDHVDKLPIHHAAMKGRADIMEALIKAGSKIDVFDKNHWTPLITAAYFGSLDAVELLIKHRCDVHLSNQNDRTALHEACRSRTETEHLPEIVKALIKAGCDVDQKCSDAGEADFTPLMYASYYGHRPLVTVLILAECDLNLQGTNGYTALHWAVDKGRTDVVHLLLQNGARADVKTMRGELAVDRTKDKTIKELLQAHLEGRKPNVPATALTDPTCDPPTTTVTITTPPSSPTDGSVPTFMSRLASLSKESLNIIAKATANMNFSDLELNSSHASGGTRHSATANGSARHSMVSSGSARHSMASNDSDIINGDDSTQHVHMQNGDSDAIVNGVMSSHGVPQDDMTQLRGSTSSDRVSAHSSRASSTAPE